MSVTTLNPANNQALKSYDETTPEEVRSGLERMHKRFSSWKQVPLCERAKCFLKAAKILKTEAAELAKLVTAEMGKPLKQAQSEIEKCAWVCEYYAEQSEKFLQNEPVETEGAESYVAFEPQGIILSIMPWNYPFWQAFRAAVPALMVGNVMILKHASNVSGCAIAIGEIFKKAGFPEDVFNVFILPSKRVAGIIADPRVRGVTLTGSVPAGKAVAKAAGEYLKKTVLELGGSDPYLILEDADLEFAVNACASSRLINGGQSCVAAKRFIVHEKIADQFERMFTEVFKAKKMGDPTDAATEVGPMARHDLRDELHEQVQKTLGQGARLLCGGTIPDDPGAFYPPTIVTDVKKGMLLYEEETFGPVATVIRVKSTEEAVQVANDSIFGLGAAVFTKNEALGKDIAEKQLDAGLCFVNDYVKSDPRLPFGGVKESGYGRELGTYGILEFANIKTVSIKKA